MAIRSYRPQTTAPGPARAPQINVGVAGDSSGAQALGQAVSGVGETLERARQSTELNDARLAVTEGIGEINTELTADTEFRGMSERYGQRLEDLQKQVIDGLSTPGLKRAMSLEVGRAKVAAEARIADRQMTLQGSHTRATLARTIRSTASAMPNAASEEEAEIAFDRAQDAIDAALEAGYISAEQAEAQRVTLDQDVSQAYVLRAINDDPAAAATALAKPGAYGLEEVDRQRYLASATRTAEAKARTDATKLERDIDSARGVLVRGGTVAAEDMAALRERARGTAYEAELEGAVQARAELGDFASATPEERAAHIADVRGRGISLDSVSIDNAQLATLEAIDTKLTAAETSEMRALGNRVKDAVTALGDGREVADLAAVTAAAEGTPFAADLALAVQRKEFVTAYDAAGPAEQKRLLEDARKAGVITSNRVADEAFLDTLEQIDAAATTALANDPVQYAIDNRLAAAAPLDLSDPESVSNRVALVNELRETHGAQPMIFSKAERKALKAVAAEGTPDEQLAMVVGVIDGFGPAATKAFSELDGIDPVVKRAGELVIETGDDEVAGIILNGRKAMQAGDELRAAPQDAITVFEEKLGGALAAKGGRREEIIEAAKAYYAQMAPGRVSADDFSAQVDLLAEGAQRVLGGEIIDGEQWGGVQEVNDRPVRLPPELNAESAEAMLSEATLEDWKAASLSEAQLGPHEGDAEVLPENAVLEWVDGSIYRVGVRGRRGVEWYGDPSVSNGYFYVDLSRLGKAVLERRAATPAASGGFFRGLFGGGN